MLKSIRLRNFKSWTDTERIRLTNLNLFFGSNSSGKTSIFQSILLMRQTSESTDRKRVFSTSGEGGLVDLGTYSDIIYRGELDRDLQLDLEWESETAITVRDILLQAQRKNSTIESSRSLSFSTRVNFSNTKHPVQEIEYKLGESTFQVEDEDGKGNGKYHLESSAVQLVRAPGRRWPLRDPSKFYGFPDEVRIYYQNAEFLADLELELERQLGRVRYLGPLRSDPQRQYIYSGGVPEDVGIRGDLTINALVAAQREGMLRSRGFIRRRDGLRSIPRVAVETVVAGWLQELGLIHRFAVRSVDDRDTLYRVLVQRSEHSPEVLLTDVGFGVSQVLPVLTLLAYAQDGDSIVLEQPEIHLHPAVQSRLADILLETAIVRNVQLIVESHSEHLLTRIQRRIAEGVFGKNIEIAPEKVSLYFCEQGDGTTGSSIRELEVDLFGNISNWPSDFFGDPMEDVLGKINAVARRADG